MLRRIFWMSGAASLAVAALLFAGTPVHAQHHGGGGHGGGGHGGGSHASGYHGGGGAYHGGYHGGGYNHGGYGGYHGGYGYHHGGWGYGLGGLYLGLGGYYPGYAYGRYPSYDLYAPTYNYYSVAPDTYYYGSDLGTYAPPAVAVPPADVQPGFVVPGTTTAPAATNSVMVTVDVPADARVWFNGTPTRQTGSERNFVSPPVEPGKTYTYTIRAQWNQDGKDVMQERSIDVQAGSHPVVNFFQPVK